MKDGIVNKNKKEEFAMLTLVSIIIPIYNTGKFLEEAIDSVLNQTLPNIEIILVNDGSTDNSHEICESKRKKDARIIYLKQKNQGVSIARNNGLSKASGEYIYFMDSDDSIDDKFIELSYKAAKSKNKDLIIIGEYYCKRLPNKSAFPTCSLMISHLFLKNNKGIRFPKGIQPCEDGLFSHQLFALTDKIGLNPLGKYYYRDHDNQNHILVNKNTSIILNQIPEWLDVLKSFYFTNNLFKTHSYHLALFIEHEPFELRYLKMPFNKNQKEVLFKLIKNFMFQNVLPNLKKENKLSIPFKTFLDSNSYKEFDFWYERFLKKKKNIKRLLVLFSKIIPVSSYRRKIRHLIHEKYV